MELPRRIAGGDGEAIRAATKARLGRRNAPYGVRNSSRGAQKEGPLARPWSLVARMQARSAGIRDGSVSVSRITLRFIRATFCKWNYFGCAPSLRAQRPTGISSAVM